MELPAAISGTVEKIIFHSRDTGFSVMLLRSREHKELITTVGSCHSIYVGEVLVAKGQWHHDPKYGKQFKASTIESERPASPEGIERYLSSGVIKGVGPAMAKRIVEAFGENTLAILERQPDMLLHIEGIGKNKLASITESWLENEAARSVILFFQDYNVNTSTAMRIFRHYGNEAIGITKANPYQLAYDIKGMGFLTADKIATSMGVPLDSQQRANAAVEYVLQQAAVVSGCCSLPYDVLVEKCDHELSVPLGATKEAITTAIEGRRLIAVGNCLAESLIFLSIYYYMEKNIARMLMAMDRAGFAIGQKIDLVDSIEWLRIQYKIRLSSSQQEALGTILKNKVTIVTGGPGTGKTTLINSLIKVLKNYDDDLMIKLAAPTGRAAKRMSESAKTHATTIHRLLEFDPVNGGFFYNENHHLKCDLLIIDESSMIDVHLMHSVLKAMPATASLVMVGDIDQLPSVGPGQVLADLIGSEMLSVVRLNKIFRQASYSAIVTNAHMINRGYVPSMENDSKDFQFHQCEQDNAQHIIMQMVTRLCKETSHQEVMQSVQILTPMQRTNLGVQSLNFMLQPILNPNAGNGPYLERSGLRFYAGDKVMQIENDYDKHVFNGDIGYIQSIDLENREMLVNFDHRVVAYDGNDLERLVLAYAITIHKSQGSEYQRVIIPIVKQHYIMLNRNLIYTGITRAKDEVILVGEKAAMAMAVKNNRISERYSCLNSWLKQEIGDSTS